MSEDAPPDLAALLAIYPLFRTLDDDTLRTLASEMQDVQLAQGEVLFQQGDAGDAMYVVVGGALGVRMEDPAGTATVLNRVGPGETVGEMALLTGQPRSATVQALAESTLVKLPKSAFDRLAERQPEIARCLAQTALPLFHRTQLVGILKRLLGPLDMPAIHDLEAQFEWQCVGSGEVLIRQGDAGDAMFIVVSGRLRVVRRDDEGAEQTLGEIGAGQIVGEFALLTDEPRSATVYGVRDTTVVRLSRGAFEQVMERYPRSLMGITRLVLKQRHRPAGAPADAAATFAVVPLHPSVPLHSFAARLAGALGAFGPTLHLDSARMDERFGKAGIAGMPPDHPLNTSVLAWLDEHERQHRYVVYEAEAEWSNWTQRCVRQADRVLFIGDAGADHRFGEIERAVQAGPVKARRELVLVHPGDCARPSGTRAWLDCREVAAHHHVRIDNEADLERLARRLTGRAWGLVLGGGGARGYAHVGVYRAMLEAGLPIDFVGGTSMGAVLGACIAMGLDYQAIRRLAERVSSPLRLFDPTIPLVALFSSNKVTATLMGVYEETQVEDLWCPFFSVSSNLTRAVQTVHRKGPLWQAVRASMAIPGIFSPILCHGDLEVDGAVLNNLPIDVMREVNQGGPMVAVNVSPEVDLTTAYRFGPSISGSRALLSLLNPIDTVSVPLIFESLLRVVALNDVQRAKAKRHLASIYICPPVDCFGILEFGSWAQIIDTGYKAAVEAIEASGTAAHAAAERKSGEARPASGSGFVTERLGSVLDRLEHLLPDEGTESESDRTVQSG